MVSSSFSPQPALAGRLENYVQIAKEYSELTSEYFNYHGVARKIINLNGTWQAKIDDDQTLKQVWIPGSYQSEGEVEFQRRFQIDSSLTDYAFVLYAFGVNNNCSIFVNDEYQGGHVGGFSSFKIILNKENLIIGGENQILVLVDNTSLPRESLPLKHSPRLVQKDGGIFRDIFIVAMPTIFIDEVALAQEFSDDFTKCRLTVNSVIRQVGNALAGDSLDLKVRLELWQPGAQSPLASAPELPVHSTLDLFTISAELELEGFDLWRPEHPQIYELRVLLTDSQQIYDEVRLTVGISELKISGKQFVLNGQPLLLQGVDWFENFPDYGAAAGWQQIQQEVLRLKSTGANAVRVVGTPPHPFFLEICDKVGLLVFEELPLSVTPDQRFQDPKFINMVMNYLDELVRRDAHHVSLAGLGMGCDLEFTKSPTLDILQKMRERFRRYSRKPVYVSFRNVGQVLFRHETDFILVEAFGKNVIQLSGFLNGFANYDGPVVVSLGYPLRKNNQNLFSFDEVIKTRAVNPKDRIALQIEVQEIQAYQLQQALKAVTDNPQITGRFIHTYADWLGARPGMISGAEENPYLNASGMVTLSREKRTAFDVVQAFFKSNPTANIAPRFSSVQNPVVYPVSGIVLILFFLFNFNRSRRLRGNLRRIFLYPHGFYMELADNRKVSAGHTFLLSVVTSAVLGIVLSSIAFYFRNDLLANEMLDLLIGSPQVKLFFVELVWQPARFILFAVAGFYVLSCFIILVFKLISFFLGKNLPIGQFFTLIFWVGANFIWLLPITPIYYRILNQTSWKMPAVSLLLLFTFWFGVRMFRGIKVVFNLTMARALSLTLILFILFFGGLGWYYDTYHAFFDYLPMYWDFAMNQL
ncbi:MAG: glycoside hydrolase family 2 TIM barrel-domain containing protein [bacterium]